MTQVRFSDPFTTKWVKKNLSFPESTESTQVLLHSSQKIWLTLSKTSTLVGTTKPPNFLTIPHFPSSTSVNMWISSTTDWLGDRFVWIHVTKKERPILSHHFTIPQPMTLRIGWYYIVVWMNGEYKVMDKCRISTTRRSISWPTSVGLTLIWGVPPSCPAAQPVLPISHQPRQNQAEGGTAKNKVNPTEVRQEMDHPVLYKGTLPCTDNSWHCPNSKPFF